MPSSENYPNTPSHVGEDHGLSRMETKNDQEKQDGTSSSTSSTSSSGVGGGGDKQCCSKEENDAAADDDHVAVAVVDVNLKEHHLGVEKVCRICHLSGEESSGSSELIHLGCHCREELGISHPHCAETWFKQRGNRLCEICNKTAKNVRFIKDTRIFVMEINDRRPPALAAAPSFEFPGGMRNDRSRMCKQSCNFMVGCLVLAFLISTFMRVKIF